MTFTLSTHSQAIYAKLDINLQKIPLEKRHHYRAIKYFLTVEDEPLPEASSLEQVSRYLQSLYHLCQLQAGEYIKFILSIPIFINPSRISLSLPLYEYLLFKGLSRTLLEESQQIINSLTDTDRDITYIIMLKARALSDISGATQDACLLFKEICSKTQEGSDIHTEATARLGIRQVSSGIYQEGILNLKKSLTVIDYLLEDHPEFGDNKLRFYEIKSDILESFAFYKMNSSNFTQAIDLYVKIIEIRDKYGWLHKLIGPLVHQGILMRRMGNYNQAMIYLNEAKARAVEISNENNPTWIDHHLAYVHLNQGKISEAEKLCKSSLEGYKRIESLGGISDCYEQLGLINLAKREIKDAEKYFEMSLNIRKSIGNLHGSASSVLDLALVYWHNKRYLKSIRLLLLGFSLYYKIGVLNHVRFARMLKLAYVWTLGDRKWTM